MLKLTTLATAVAATMADVVHPINDNIVTEIKEKTDKWQPYEPTENPLNGMNHIELFGLLGTVYRPAYGNKQPEMENVQLPKSFDARE